MQYSLCHFIMILYNNMDGGSNIFGITIWVGVCRTGYTLSEIVSDTTISPTTIMIRFFKQKYIH